MAFETSEFPHRFFENLKELDEARRERSRLAAQLAARKQDAVPVKAEVSDDTRGTD